MTLQYRTYAENIRVAAKEKRLKISDLATATGYSFEHIRNIWKGHSKDDKPLTVSRNLNDLLCGLLDLPAETMFDMAEREKFHHKHGYAPLRLPDAAGQEMAELWGALGDDQKDILLRMARSFKVELAIAS